MILWVDLSAACVLTAWLTIAVSAAPPRMISPPSTYYMPMIPQYGNGGGGGGDDGGYVVSAYVPQYATYHIVTPVHRPNPPASSSSSYSSYENDQQPSQTYEVEEPKYYYGGKFKGTCYYDGLYYKDETDFVICSNGYASEQQCPPGTKTDAFPSYQPGYYYGSSDLCTVNLVDFGYGPYTHIAQLLSQRHADSSDDDYEKKRPAVDEYHNQVSNDNYEKPQKDNYDTPSDNTYPPKPPTYPVDTGYQPPAESYPASDSHSSSSGYNKNPYSSDDTSHQQRNRYPTHKSPPYSPSSSTAVVSSYHSPEVATDSYPPPQTGYDQMEDIYQPRNPYTMAESDSSYHAVTTDIKSDPYSSNSYHDGPAAVEDRYGRGYDRQPRLTYTSRDRKY